MKILFLVSGGISHLTRSLELARYLKEKNIEVVFACGKGKWEQLVHLYGFVPKYIQEVKFEGRTIYGIKSFKSSNLLEVYKSELKVINTIKPDVIIADWRITARQSASLSRIPCIQIWNVNWGILGGYPNVVNSDFFIAYKKLISKWTKEYKNFLKKINGDDEVEFFNGNLNIVPDDPFFRAVNYENDCIKLVGPIVPRPIMDIGNKCLSRKKMLFDILICFGGHKLPNYAKFIIDVYSSKGIRVGVLKSERGRLRNRENFSFFPNILNKSKIVLTHGGSGTIYQSLLARKPLIVIPQHLEHMDNAKCVEKLNFGVVLFKNKLSKKSLLDAYNNVDGQHFYSKVNEYAELLNIMNPLEGTYSLIKNYIL